MDAEHSSRVIAWSAEYFADVSYVVYEQILPDDAFGRVMLANIHARGCDLRSIHAFPTLEAQAARFRKLAFEAAQAWDMNQVYYDYLDASERAKYDSMRSLLQMSWYLHGLTHALSLLCTCADASASRSLTKLRSSTCSRRTTASSSRVSALRQLPQRRLRS